MKILWKKLVTASRCTRVIFAFLYTFISLTTPLNHTCNLAGHKTVDCHKKYMNHGHDLTSHAEIKTALGEIGSACVLCKDSQHCAACLYSLLAKSSGPSPEVLPVIIQSPPIIQVPIQFKFIKQFEYLSCASLRAPPGITS